ncbi:tetratricopeptide repeat-containing sensor histidine kinase [Sphingobacterium endophyticum]|uniref:tetratricopeptide repeat-containing sensor histidine kinase n=1 Tax=Sphingobacterium endophyticum TaxID=2546448 RepID=UPI0012E0CDBE|nr:tetratricopeptide repeat-containing sensor histidine kinase [Sphingobacterium endophyticum]
MRPMLIFVWILILISCNKTVVKELNPIESEHLEKAYGFLDNNESDSAYLYFDKARISAIEQNDTATIVASLINMAITQAEFGDHYTSQETSTKALEYLNEQDTADHSYLSMLYNNLSNASDYLKQPEKSIEYIQLAIDYAKDPRNIKVYKNNLANNYADRKEYDKSIQLYEEIIATTDSNSTDYARFITNYARIRNRIDSNFNPLPLMKKALKIRFDQDDYWGLNSSYSNIANYYMKVDQDSALNYSNKQYEISKKIKNPEAQIASLQRILSLRINSKDKDLFKEFYKLDDSVQLARLSSRNHFALIRFETEKNKLQNIQLKNEIVKKQYNINLQRIGIVALFIIIGLTSYYAWNWHKRKKQRIELEADNRIKESQLKTSRKVHDVVANGIYRVMAELENRESIDREEILDRLELMYDKSRDISYEAEDNIDNRVGFYLQISELLKSFANDHRTVLIAGNEEEMWKLLSNNQKSEIEKILQELMVNMQKHSFANEVIVKFEYDSSDLLINYKDNGIGIKEDSKIGNGLNNTETRINNLKGKITFEHHLERGLEIRVSIPIIK